MKITTNSKWVGVVTLSIFTLTQVLPLGWAIDPGVLSPPADLEQAPTQSAEDVATDPTPQEPTPPANNIDFLMGDSPISSTPPAELPQAPAPGLTNDAKPVTLFHTESDWAETMRQWGGTVRTLSENLNNIIKDILTTFRKYAGDFWTKFIASTAIEIRSIAEDAMGEAQSWAGRGFGSIRLNVLKTNEFLVNRWQNMVNLTHEIFHYLGNALDGSLGLLPYGLGGQGDERSTDYRSQKVLERIANNASNPRGWREIMGNEWTSRLSGKHFFFSQTEKNSAYTINIDPVSGERTVNRYTAGDINWGAIPLQSSGYVDKSKLYDNKMVFTGISEVYRADNTLARIIQYQRAGAGVLPGVNNPISSITYYDASGRSESSRADYIWAENSRHQVITRNGGGDVLSATWYQTLNGVTTVLPDGWNVPANVTATVPTATGLVTLSGARAANTSIWYSFDNGTTYKQLVASGTATSWTGNLYLPVGSSTVSVISRTTAIVSGVANTLVSSQAVNLGTVIYTPPVVPVPTGIMATMPTATGLVTLSGARVANTSIWYSLDGGVTYKQLVAVGSVLSWTGNLYLPVGSSTVLVVARKVATVSGVANTLVPSLPVNLGAVTYTPPVVSVPTDITATLPTATGSVTLSGKRAANTSIWYSLDNGTTYKQLVVSGNATSWTGNLYLPVGSSTVLVRARKIATVSGVANTLLSSQPVNLGAVTYTPPVVPVPTNITATVPTATGLVTLSGARTANTSIWYSLDGGVSYKQLVVSGSATSWTGNLYLPVGASTVLVQARKIATVSGVANTLLSSQPVNLGAVTYTPPVVPVPTSIMATMPTATGLVTLSGARVANTSIWYSLDNGVTYKQLVAAGSVLSWTGNLYLPVGASTVLVQARKTATVSGVANTLLSSQLVNLGAVTYTPPVVPVPTNVTASVPSVAGVVTLSGARIANTSIWYSLDGGVTYKQLVAVGSVLVWTGRITLPVGASTVLVQTRKIATVSGVSNTVLSSLPVDLGAITYQRP